MRVSGAALLLIASAGLPCLAGGITPIPEPGTMLLMGGGLAAAVLLARSRRKK